MVLKGDIKGDNQGEYLLGYLGDNAYLLWGIFDCHDFQWISRGIFTGMYNQQRDGTNHLTWGYIYILVGGDWNMAFMTCHIVGMMIQSDFHIFQGGGSTTNQ